MPPAHIRFIEADAGGSTPHIGFFHYQTEHPPPKPLLVLRHGIDTSVIHAALTQATAYRVDSECPMGSVAASIQGPTPYEMLYPSESAR